MTQGHSGFLMVSEVAQLFRCDPETVKRQARSRKLDGFKFGKAWFFRPRDIDAMIDDAIVSLSGRMNDLSARAASALPERDPGTHDQKKRS